MAKKQAIQHIDSRDSIRVVTSNSFVTACGLEKASLKARKLLYLAISQCRKNDDEFYEYRITVPEFAEIMGIDASNVYDNADALTDELFKGFITEKDKDGFEKYSLFSKCRYDGSAIYFKLNPDMTDFMLHVKGSFSQPLLNDFMKMNSPMSMAIWHLMQREMHSKKPVSNEEIIFDLLLEELRFVTDTENTFSRMSDFKRYVLDKAIREIKDNCGVVVTYTPIKKSRTIIGFKFTARGEWHRENLSLKQKKRLRYAELVNKKSKGTMTPEEFDELEELSLEINQMSIYDYLGGKSND